MSKKAALVDEFVADLEYSFVFGSLEKLEGRARYICKLKEIDPDENWEREARGLQQLGWQLGAIGLIAKHMLDKDGE